MILGILAIFLLHGGKSLSPSKPEISVTGWHVFVTEWHVTQL